MSDTNKVKRTKIDSFHAVDCSEGRMNEPQENSLNSENRTPNENNEIKIKISNKDVHFTEVSHENMKKGRLTESDRMDENSRLENKSRPKSLSKKLFFLIKQYISNIKNEITGKKGGNTYSLKTFIFLFATTFFMALIAIVILNHTVFKTGVSSRIVSQIEYYEDLVDKKPNDSALRIQLGQTYLLNKQEEMAIEQFNKALDLKKNDYPAILNLALTYQTMGDYEKAIDYGKQALVLSNAELDAYLILSESYQKLGKYPEALDYLVKAKAIFPSNVEILVELGSLSEKMGNSEYALEYYQQAFSYHPSSKKIQEAIARLSAKETK